MPQNSLPATGVNPDSRQLLVYAIEPEARARLNRILKEIETEDPDTFVVETQDVRFCLQQIARVLEVLRTQGAIVRFLGEEVDPNEPFLRTILHEVPKTLTDG